MTAASDQQYCNFDNSNTNHSYFKEHWLLVLNLESFVAILWGHIRQSKKAFTGSSWYYLLGPKLGRHLKNNNNFFVKI